MADDGPDIENIIQQLLEGNLEREQRVNLLRALVQRGESLPDSDMNDALEQLMQRKPD